MTTRQELLHHWESGLEANARQSDDKSRLHWLHRVYVRIYRFLISRYGRGEWRTDSVAGASNEEVELATNPMPFVDHTVGVSGLQPKSKEQIRGKLAAIHVANDHQQPPGIATRLSVQQYVAVASSKDRKTADRICMTLTAHGFQVQKVNRTTDYSLQVPYGDFEEALIVLRNGEWRTKPKSIRSFRLVRTTDRLFTRGERILALFGLTLGGFACLALFANIVNDAAAYAPNESLLLIGILVAVGLFCALITHFRR